MSPSRISTVLEAIDRREDGFRPGAHSDVIGQVRPSDLAGGIDDELGGARDVFTISAAVGVEHAVPANGFCLGVGEKRKRIAAGLAELLRFGGCIDADCDDFKAALVKVI